MFTAIIANIQPCVEQNFTTKYVIPLLPYFEIFYYLCTLGLLIVAIIGLRQIVLVRKIAKTNAKRDSLKVAAEQCKTYADKIVPLAGILDKKTENCKLKYAFSLSVEKNKILVHKEQEITKQDYCDFFEFQADFANLFNAIESFCQYLTSGLADEKNAYLCLGDSFLSLTTPYIPILVEQAQNGHMWCNTLRIYVLWYCRKQKDFFEQQQCLLNEKNSQLEKQKKKYDEKGIGVLDVDSLCK